LRILFAHQSFPAQFRYLAPGLANIGHEVVFISLPAPSQLSGVKHISYSLDLFSAGSDPLLHHIKDCLRHGLAARDTALKLKKDGFLPDVILTHPGWGDAMFLRDIFPKSKMMCFLEFFFTPEGNFFDFGQEAPSLDIRATLHMRNIPLLLALNESSWNIAPTRWQKHVFPEVYQKCTTTLHEGINVKRYIRGCGGQVQSSNGTILRDGMEIVTFVARYLEPIRGFYTFMRAADLILKSRPNAHIVVAGGEHGRYGDPPPDGQTHMIAMLQELDLDLSRVHFFGFPNPSAVITLLQISRVHLFLTYPFLISWSVLEALACNCVVLASDTGPCREIISHGVNGLLIDFFDHSKFAEIACKVLDNPGKFAYMGEAGRQTVLDRFDAIKNVNQQIDLVKAVASGANLPEEEVVIL
jgi:glycosyltransferase involved in cell wall biosynthesis